MPARAGGSSARSWCWTWRGSGSAPTARVRRAGCSGSAGTTCRACVLQPGQVVAEVVDVGVVQRARHAGHVAGVVGARLVLEGLELLDHVVVVLPRDAGDLVLPREAAEVAH